MQELASKIKDNLGALSAEYGQRLREAQSYAEMPDRARLQAARSILIIVATYLAEEDDAAFTEAVERIVSGGLDQGLTTESLLHTVDSLEATIIPRVTSVEADAFVWRMLSRAQSIIARQASERLRQSEANYRQLVDRSPVGIFRSMPEGQIAEANPAFLRIVGYDSLEAINKVGMPGLYQDPADGERLLALLQHGSVSDFETRLRRLDGRVVDVSINVHLIGEEGQPRVLEGTLEDITERKEAAEVAERRLESLGTMVELTAQLAAERSADGLCRRAVELGREKLDIDRASIWLVDQDGKRLRGTFGTNEEGETRDERDASLEILEDSPSGQILAGKSHVHVTEEPLRDDREGIHGFGWHITVPLQRYDGSVFGLLNADTLLTARAWDDYTVQILQLYGLAVGHLLDGVQMQESLRGSQQMLQLIMDNIPQSIFWKDRDLVYLGCNRRFAADVGLISPDEIVGKTDFDMPWAAQVDLYRADDRQVMEFGEPKFNFEEPQTTPDGGLIWLRTTKVPLRDVEGNVTAVLGMYEDITERKRAEAALLESERKFREFYLSVRDGVANVDMEGNILECNAVFQEMVGYSPEEFQAIKFADLTPEKWHAMEWKILEEQVLPHGYALYEKEYVRKDGAIFPVEMAVYLTRGEDGHPTGFWGFIRDITERKWLEQQIQESLQRRGQQMEISTQVAQEIAAAPALGELFRRVVTLVKERFGYYHAQIFRYEPALDAVVLVEGYGEAGEKMLAEGHRLTMGRGVVGTAAATAQPALATDVSVDQDWRPNPHLPETEGELAVPIKWRDEVLGILDVQSEVAGALTEDDQIMLEGLCGQIAVAIEGARLRQEMEERLAELNTLYRTMSREGWESLRSTVDLPSGYLFDRTDVRQADDLWVPEIGQAVEQGAIASPTLDESRDGASGQPAAVAPLAVYGEILGAFGVYDDPEHPLSPEDLALVQSVSEQVAQALESARLFKQTQTVLAQTEALYEGSDRVIRATTAREVLEALIRSTALQRLDQAALSIFDQPWEQGGEPPLGMTLAATWVSSGEAPPAPAGTYVRLDQFPAAGMLGLLEPTVIRDVVTDERLDTRGRKFFEEIGVQGAIFLPLVVGGQSMGGIVVQSRRPLQMSEDEVRQISSLAEQAAAVLRSQHLYEQTQAALEEVQAVHRRYLRESWQDYLEARGRTARPAYLYDQSQVVQGAEVDLPEIGRALKQRKLVIGDGDEEGSRAVALPISLRGQPIGALAIEPPSDGRPWSEEELALVEAVSEQLALAIDGARLFEETQMSAQRERTLREMAERVRAAADMEALLRSAAQEIRRVLGARRATVRLGTSAPVAHTGNGGDSEGEEVALS